MRLLDARRLTGPNLYAPIPVVLAEFASAPGEDREAATKLYLSELEGFYQAVGLGSPALDGVVTRPYAGGFAVAVPGPIDTLLAATEAAEWAADSAIDALSGLPHHSLEPRRSQIAAMVAEQSSPRLLAIARAARARGLPLLWDDERVTVGAGARSRSWPRAEVPDASDIPWAELAGIPMAFITGTNGKTTSARLVARLGREGGQVAGCSSTDGITVNGVFVEEGDCTGPFAARTLLARPDVEVAVLETARGGILRRGLAVEVANVALITNVSDDHLGTYGIDDVPSMARVKAVVGNAVRPGGRVVLHADDVELMGLASTFAAPVVLFGSEPSSKAIAKHLREGGEAWTVIDGAIVRCTPGAVTPLCPINDIPIAYGGAASFNIRNALGAAATAHHLGVPDDAIAKALRGFEPTDQDNPGRGNLFTVQGVSVLLDFAHNAEAIRAVLEFANALRAPHRLTLAVGLPGDRSDAP